MLRASLFFMATLLATSSLQAQVAPPTVPALPNRTITLEQYLTARLKATRQEQRDYIRLVVDRVRQDRLERKLVIAIERYAVRRNPPFPFPFFERAMRYEAAKQGVALPTVEQVASTKAPRL